LIAQEEEKKMGNDHEASKLQEKIGDAFVITCLFVSLIFF
jgi:hypothetical protein